MQEDAAVLLRAGWIRGDAAVARIVLGDVLTLVKLRVQQIRAGVANHLGVLRAVRGNQAHRFVPILLRFVLAGRRRVPHATTLAFAIGAMLCLTVNDALAVSGVVGTPYLLDLAYVIPVGVVGYALTARFAADARALEVLEREIRLEAEFLVRQRSHFVPLSRSAEAT